MKKNKIKKIVDKLHIYLEKIIIKNYFLLKAYIFLNKGFTLKEIKMIDIPNDSKVLCIGCGAVPWTLIILAKMKKWDLLGIDKNTEAVDSARKVIEYFNLSDKIKIKKVNGLDFNISNFDLVTIAFGVHPRKELLKKFANSLKDNSMILYRTTWKYLDRIYEEESIPKTFIIKNVCYRIDGLKTLLLVRNKKYNLV